MLTANMFLMDVGQSLSATESDESRAGSNKLTLRYQALRDSKFKRICQIAKVLVYQWRLDSLYSVTLHEYLCLCCHPSHLIVTLHRCTFSYCFFLCHSFCCGHAVRAYSMSFTKTGFLSSVKLLLFLPSLPTPLLLEATLYADETLLMVFAVSWGILWFLI